MTSKFTAPRRRTAVGLFSEGLTVDEVARGIEVKSQTLNGWLTRGRRETAGAYADFAEDVKGAREEAAAQEQPMTEDELRLVVSRAANRGSVQAQKLYWEMIRGDENEEEATPEDGFEQIDQLAEARSRKSA